ncbi:MAG: hypothetical protein LBT00_06260 [Spirochaetaceae bacterium]|nr:hypothetical protein [Spirochaetaceae bacterium]
MSCFGDGAFPSYNSPFPIFNSPEGWDSLRLAVCEAKTSFSPKNRPNPAFPPG